MSSSIETLDVDNSKDQDISLIKLTCAVRTIGINTIIVPKLMTAYIRLVVVDIDEKPVPEAPYQILDDDLKIMFTGQTDNQGYISHDDVALCDYTLVVGGYICQIPAVSYEDEHTTVFLPELGYIRLEVFDSTDSAFANMPYDIKSDQIVLFSGQTDAKGYIYHDLVPLHDFQLLIGGDPRSVPAVYHDEHAVSVFIDNPANIR